MSDSSKKAVNILILGRFGDGCGNNTTANRIRRYMLDSGYDCELKESDSFDNVDVLHQYLINNCISCIIGIHALRAGKLLRDVCCPYGLVFGGTDVNEYRNDPHCKDVMLQAITNARVLIAFSQLMANDALHLWPAVMEKKFYLIPQAVITSPARCSTRADWLASHQLPVTGRLFTLVAGLRPVKDPLFLVHSFSCWHQQKQPRCYLVIAGPSMDEEFSRRFMRTTEGLPGIIYVGVLSLADTHRLIAESFALVNSSLSEGVCTAVLEAMDLGVVVMARNVAGNTALVTDMQTGVIYSTPEEFTHKAELLMENNDLRDRLQLNAQQYVQQQHNPHHEKQQYISVISELIHGTDKL